MSVKLGSRGVYGGDPCAPSRSGLRRDPQVSGTLSPEGLTLKVEGGETPWNINNLFPMGRNEAEGHTPPSSAQSQPPGHPAVYVTMGPLPSFSGVFSHHQNQVEPLRPRCL